MTPNEFDSIYRSVLMAWTPSIPITLTSALQIGSPNPQPTLADLRSMLVTLPLFSDNFPRQPSSAIEPLATFLETLLFLKNPHVHAITVPDNLLSQLDKKNNGPGNPVGAGSIARTCERIEQINRALDTGMLETLLYKPPFEPTKFLKALAWLEELPGVSLAAAQHILSDIGWPVVKPDLHVVRVLFRLGGWGRNHFKDAEAKLVNLPEKPNQVSDKRYPTKHLRALMFQQAYQQFYSSLGKECFAPPAPGIQPSSQLALRQIDRVLMMFTQTRTRGDLQHLVPICTSNPGCSRCLVETCESRADQ